MMTSIANINSNFSIDSVKYRMTQSTFHIVSRFIKVTDSWNMIFSTFSNVIPVVSNYHWETRNQFFFLKKKKKIPTCSIPNNSTMLHISFKNRWNNNHVMFSCHLWEKKKLDYCSEYCSLWKRNISTLWMNLVTIEFSASWANSHQLDKTSL